VNDLDIDNPIRTIRERLAHLLQRFEMPFDSLARVSRGVFVRFAPTETTRKIQNRDPPTSIAALFKR
jgi:hypothetical protein